jgi:molybdopterin-guanine dinucleotide biosynthesis protein A
LLLQPSPLQLFALWIFLELDIFRYDRGMDISAFVLAGGHSRRMGADKAFVEFDGYTLLDRMLTLARAASSDVHILGSKEKFAAYGDVVEDQFPDHGPLGGIHAALRASTAELNVILAIDMPFLEERFLKYLLQQAEQSDVLVTVPRGEGVWQPLCAVYRKPFAALAEEALQVDKNKIDPLFRNIQLRIIEEAELTQQGFSPAMFRNVNTPEELQEAISNKSAVRAESKRVNPR